MSLLNDMLRDLHRNRAALPKAAIVPRPVAAFRLRRIRSALAWLLMPGLLSLFLFLLQDPLPNSGFSLPGIAAPTPEASIDSDEARLMNLTAMKIQAATEQQRHTIPAQHSLKHYPSSLPAMPVPALRTQVAQQRVHKTPILASQQIEPSVNKIYNNLNAKEWQEMQLHQAMESVQSGNDTKARELLELLLAKYPSSTQARENLAALYLSQGDYAGAKELIDTGLSIKPNALGLISMKARLYLEQNQPRLALQLLERHNPDINQEPDYYGLLASALQSLGRLTEAGALYKSLITIEPKNGQYWLGYALALERKKDYQQATEAYNRAMDSYDLEPSVRAYAENRLKVLQG